MRHRPSQQGEVVEVVTDPSRQLDELVDRDVVGDDRQPPWARS